MLSPCLSLATGDFANVCAVTLGTRTGTYVDASYYFFADGTTVDRLPLTLLSVAFAVVADLRGERAYERVMWADLADAAEGVDARTIWRQTRNALLKWL